MPTSLPDMLPLVIKSLGMAFLAVVFIQSGLDKISDRKGNLEWLTGHFSKSFLRNSVPLLLTTLTGLELLSGVGAVLSIAELFCCAGFPADFLNETDPMIKSLGYNNIISHTTFALCLLTFLSLFTGQRIAKDYAGAVTIISYVVLTIVLWAIWNTNF